MTQLSLEALQKQHEELLKLNENAEISEADITQVEEFLKNLAAAGAYIEDPDQRSLLRAYIRYWANFVDDKTGSFPPTQLQPFPITGLQAGGGTENVTGNLETPVTRKDSPFDLSPAPRRSYLNFFRKPIRSYWLGAVLTLIIIIFVIIAFILFRSSTPSPNATRLTPQEVQLWCSTIPYSSGTCNLSRFEQVV